nr:uncharacterized protein LOC112074254 [Salvelinus alpinus]
MCVENAAALEELLLSTRVPGAVSFDSVPLLTQTIVLTSLTSTPSLVFLVCLAPDTAYCCSRCAQKKWPPSSCPLSAPQNPHSSSYPPQTPLSPLLLPPRDLQVPQKTPLLPPVDTHHSTTKISQTPRAGSGLLPEGKWRMLGEVTRSVGRFQVAQIQEQRPGSMEMIFCPESSDSDSVEDSSLLGANKSSSSSSSSAARGTQESTEHSAFWSAVEFSQETLTLHTEDLNIRREECWVKITLPR